MFAETVYFLRKNSINLSTFAEKTKAMGFFYKKFTKFTKFTHFRVVPIRTVRMGTKKDCRKIPTVFLFV